MHTVRLALLTGNANPIPNNPGLLAQVGEALRAKLTDAFKNGYWFCLNCQRLTERIEPDNGQPAFCARCRSPRLEYHPPIFMRDGCELLHPGQL